LFLFSILIDSELNILMCIVTITSQVVSEEIHENPYLAHVADNAIEILVPPEYKARMSLLHQVARFQLDRSQEQNYAKWHIT